MANGGSILLYFNQRASPGRLISSASTRSGEDLLRILASWNLRFENQWLRMEMNNTNKQIRNVYAFLWQVEIYETFGILVMIQMKYSDCGRYCTLSNYYLIV